MVAAVAQNTAWNIQNAICHNPSPAPGSPADRKNPLFPNRPDWLAPNIIPKPIAQYPIDPILKSIKFFIKIHRGILLFKSKGDIPVATLGRRGVFSFFTCDGIAGNYYGSSPRVTIIIRIHVIYIVNLRAILIGRHIIEVQEYPTAGMLEKMGIVFVVIYIKGRQVYQQAIRRIVETVNNCLQACDLTIDDISMLVSHQMNARIIESAAKRLELPDEKVFINISEYGNTSAASVPIAFDDCVRKGRIKRGDIVILVAFGAGLTWGANVIEF